MKGVVEDSTDHMNPGVERARSWELEAADYLWETMVCRVPCYSSLENNESRTRHANNE
jgi:hypothetical protein